MSLDSSSPTKKIKSSSCHPAATVAPSSSPLFYAWTANVPLGPQPVPFPMEFFASPVDDDFVSHEPKNLQLLQTMHLPVFPFPFMDPSPPFGFTLWQRRHLFCFGGAVPLPLSDSDDIGSGVKIDPTTGRRYRQHTGGLPVMCRELRMGQPQRLFEPEQSVYRCDLVDSSMGEWQSCTPMMAKRCQPSVVAYNDSILVFGCSLTPLKELRPFAEKFDPETQNWETLIEELPLLHYVDRVNAMGATKCVLVENETKVLVILTKLCLCFTFSLVDRDPFFKSPTPLQRTEAEGIPRLPYLSCPMEYTESHIAVVDDLIFAFIGGLYVHRLEEGAFNLSDDPMPTRVKFSDTDALSLPRSPSFLFHTGNMRFSVISKPDYIVRLVLRVVKNGESLQDLSAVVEGQWSYSQGNDTLVWACT